MEGRDRDDRFRVVIAGGGVAALEAALALDALAEGRLNVELVAPEPRFWYRPAAVGEPFGLAAVRSYDLGDMASRFHASFTLGALETVDSHRGIARTEAGDAIPFDALLVACGASPVPAVSGAITFRGPADTGEIEHLLDALETGEVGRVAFAVPPGAAWSLPLYELALMTAAHIAAHELEGVELTLVTPEDRPLALFGGDASDAVAALLADAGIEVHTGVYPVAFRDGHLTALPDGGVEADRVVALPRLYVPPLGGVPQTYEGFVPVDAHGRVVGLPGVWAAGDATSFPVKQGGIAAQQADAAAESIAAAAGVPVQPLPFRPVLRGLLLTGGAPRFLRGEPVARGEESLVSTEPLWWPPAKIVGRHLAPFLAGLEPTAAAPERAPAGAVAVEIPLEEAEVLPPPAPAFARGPHEPSAGDACSPGQVVAPADTVADVAERLLTRRHDAALVVEGDELIGIVTSTDLLRAMAGRIRCGESTVREWMTAEPVVLDTNAGVGEAAALMARTGLSRLVVIDGGRPVGTVTRAQLERHGVPAAVGLGF